MNDVQSSWKFFQTIPRVLLLCSIKIKINLNLKIVSSERYKNFSEQYWNIESYREENTVSFANASSIS